MEKSYDVLVIGGGPSGQNASYNLAKAGVSVCLIEADKLPKDKVCGGGLRYAALERFPYLAPIVRKVSRSAIRKITVYSHALQKATAAGAHDSYYLMRRLDFSAGMYELCKQAGVHHVLGKRVREVKITQDEATVFLQNGEVYTAKAVIGADGINSLVAKASGLNLGWPKDHYAFASEQELEFDTGLPNDEIIIHFAFHGIHGYGWIFPKGKFVNVGVGFLSTYKDAALKQVHDAYIAFLKSEHLLPEAFPLTGMRSWAIPWGGPLKKTYTNRVLLCGDAAGFPQPLTAEGIYYALTSGELAGKVMADAIQKDNVSEHELAEYQKLWHKEFGLEFKTLLSMQHFIFEHPSIIDTGLKHFGRDKEVHQYFLDFLSGRISFKEARIKSVPKITFLLAKHRFENIKNKMKG